MTPSQEPQESGSVARANAVRRAGARAFWSPPKHALSRAHDHELLGPLARLNDGTKLNLSCIALWEFLFLITFIWDGVYLYLLSTNKILTNKIKCYAQSHPYPW